MFGSNIWKSGLNLSSTNFNTLHLSHRGLKKDDMNFNDNIRSIQYVTTNQDIHTSDVGVKSSLDTIPQSGSHAINNKQ